MTFVIFLGVLSILVLIHELGHFVAARILGIKVEEFAFGLPFIRHIFQIKRGETAYSVYPLLFGGFVRLYGEEGPASAKATARQRDFWSRGRKQRMLVVAAGVIMNIVLAVVGFVALYAALGVPQSLENQVTILKVESGSPADEAGLKIDDRVIGIENKKIKDGNEFGKLMRSWAGVGVNLTVRRGKGTQLLEGITQDSYTDLVVRLTPRENPPEGQGPVGVGIADYPYITVEKCSMFNVDQKIALREQCSIRFVTAGVRTTGMWMSRVVDGLREIGRSLAAGKAPEGVAGPVGIYQLTDVVVRGGIWPLVELVAVLSVNLAVFNVLPIPALDGGRMLFIWLEWARRKRLPVELEQKINTWGMALLLGLLALISLQDVWRMGWIEKLLKR